jgi:FkbM family methyltransferase
MEIILRKIAHFIRKQFTGLTEFLEFCISVYYKVRAISFRSKYLKQATNGGKCFMFNEAILPDISRNSEKMQTLQSIFDDTFLIYVSYDDNYDISLIRKLEKQMCEGPYGYVDGKFDVTVKRNDVVIDAGAWIGDFSAYACAKGAICYAFEPANETYAVLETTAMLNNTGGLGCIYPIPFGLSDKEMQFMISSNKKNSGANKIQGYALPVAGGGGVNSTEENIQVITLDKFVKQHNLEKVDFIKADIEGAERDMLKGAAYVLKKFAPKLAICTYHFHDDPVVLEKIILEANPAYTVKHLPKKLFAMVLH